MPEIGWLTSCVMEAVIALSVASRATCVNSNGSLIMRVSAARRTGHDHVFMGAMQDRDPTSKVAR